MVPQTKLLDRVRDAIRLKHYSLRTEQAYAAWIKRFILYHNKKHPLDMGENEIRDFLTHLAVKGKVAASTQNQALNAIGYLYKRVIQREPGDFTQAIRAKRPIRKPVVLTPGEVNLLLKCLSHKPYELIVRLLYGSGLRLIECLRLRVQDLDFIRQTITVRGGKGDKDRFTMLPANTEKDLKQHLVKVQAQFQRDLRDGFADVYLPNAIARKYPKAAQQWNWQYVFPAENPSKDPRSGVMRRHHVYMGTVNRTIQKAAQLAGIRKKITAHSFRHS